VKPSSLFFKINLAEPRSTPYLSIMMDTDRDTLPETHEMVVETKQPEAPAFKAQPPKAVEPAPEPQDADDLMELATKRITQLEDALGEMREKWMRAEAEAQNIRARAKREIEDGRLYAVQKFASDVVEAAENIRRGLASVPEPEEGEPEIIKSLRDGFEGTERSFVSLLERNGIVGTDPTGTKFDPNLHQAMQEFACSDVPPGIVLKSWSRAWTLNGRLLKPAMVVVAKAES